MFHLIVGSRNGSRRNFLRKRTSWIWKFRILTRLEVTVESHCSDVSSQVAQEHSLVLIPKTERSWSGNQTRHGWKVSRSLIFAARFESAKTAKIMRLENLALYGTSLREVLAAHLQTIRLLNWYFRWLTVV